MKNHEKNINELEKKISIKIPIYRKNMFFKILHMFRDIDKKHKFLFSRVKHQFLSEFSIFLKMGFSAAIPIKRDRLCK